MISDKKKSQTRRKRGRKGESNAQREASQRALYHRNASSLRVRRTDVIGSSQSSRDFDDGREQMWRNDTDDADAHRYVKVPSLWARALA